MKKRFLAALPLLMLVTANDAAGSGEVTVMVTNVRNNAGVVHVDLCHEAEFLKDCKLSAEAKSVPVTTTVKIANVPPGNYAIQATHDENNNKKVDMGFLGIPKEGVGFSNDAPIGFSAPKWKAAVFPVAGNTTVTLKLRYFSGPSGPKH
jgi:uncharacterized protein (DUF2141 family)